MGCIKCRCKCYNHLLSILELQPKMQHNSRPVHIPNEIKILLFSPDGRQRSHPGGHRGHHSGNIYHQGRLIGNAAEGHVVRRELPNVDFAAAMPFGVQELKVKL